MKRLRKIKELQNYKVNIKRPILLFFRTALLWLYSSFFLFSTAYCSLEPKPSDCFDVNSGPNLVVHSSNYTDGYMSVINLDNGNVKERVFTPADQDSRLRSINNDLYLLTRGNANTLSRFGAGRKYCIDYEVSTGIDSNPYDLTGLPGEQGFVALYGRNEVLSLNLDTGLIDPRAPIQIPASYDTHNDNIDAVALYQHGTYLYLLIQNSDAAALTGGDYSHSYTNHASLLKIDLISRNVVEQIDLGQKNPNGMRYYSNGSTEELHIFTIGTWGDISSGSSCSDNVPALRYDLNTGAIGNLFQTSENMRCDIVDILQVSNTLAFAVTSSADFLSSLTAFNPTSGALLGSPILSGISSICNDCMLVYNNGIYLGYSDRSFTGIAVFGTSPPFNRLRDYPLNLPPYSMRLLAP